MEDKAATAPRNGFLVVECFSVKGVRVCSGETDRTRRALLSAFSRNCPSKYKAVDDRGWYCGLYYSVARAINVCNKFGWRLVTVYGAKTVYPNIRVIGFPRNEVTEAHCLVFTKEIDAPIVPESDRFVDAFNVPEVTYRSIPRLPRYERAVVPYDPGARTYRRTRGPVFGAPLNELTLSSDGVPLIIVDLITAIRTKDALRTEGLFRVSSSLATLRQVRRRLNDGELVDFSTLRDAHISANLLKMFLKSLPEPLLSTSLFNFINTIPDMATADDRIGAIQWLLSNYVTEPTHATLRYIVEYLGELAKEADVNKMHASNLALVLGPNFAWSRDEALGGAAFNVMRGLSVVLQLMISNAANVFGRAHEGGDAHGGGPGEDWWADEGAHEAHWIDAALPDDDDLAYMATEAQHDAYDDEGDDLDDYYARQEEQVQRAPNARYYQDDQGYYYDEIGYLDPQPLHPWTDENEYDYDQGHVEGDGHVEGYDQYDGHVEHEYEAHEDIHHTHEAEYDAAHETAHDEVQEVHDHVENAALDDTLGHVDTAGGMSKSSSTDTIAAPEDIAEAADEAKTTPAAVQTPVQTGAQTTAVPAVFAAASAPSVAAATAVPKAFSPSASATAVATAVPTTMTATASTMTATASTMTATASTITATASTITATATTVTATATTVTATAVPTTVTATAVPTTVTAQTAVPANSTAAVPANAAVAAAAIPAASTPAIPASIAAAIPPPLKAATAPTPIAPGNADAGNAPAAN